jgi:plastocyanin
MSTHAIGRTALALVAGFVVLGLAAPGRSQPSVSVQLFQFKPGQLEVRAGSTVTWANQDDIGHTVTSGTPEQRDGRFDLALDGKGATASVQLREPGTYPYFCRRHQSMRGAIHVK